ncbi:MAG: transporter associated domain-containing protein, partial [Candidatus Sumerlaeota bacterium]
VNPADNVPAPIAAGSLLWDWLVRSSELLYRQFHLVRPRAYLFEQDDELLMAVGAVEMQAVGDKLPVSATPSTADERTEHEMIRSIQKLDNTLVREVMRPLNTVTAVGLTNLTTEKFLALARRTGYTRFPCYYDQVTNLIGFLNVYDFVDNKIDTSDPSKLVRRVTFIPEIARVDLALREMLRTKSQVEICYDEFGGCSGLLSREDIIEEITGEIMDEYDRPETKIQSAHGHHLVDGSIDLDDLTEALGLQLEKKNCDTLAGYIYQRLSRTPRRGESFEEHGWKIEVVQLDNHRIRRVRLTPPTAEGEAAADSSAGT